MFTLTLNTDNAAFDEPHAEIARILREVADRIEAGKFTRSLHDINGNTVGRVDWIARLDPDQCEVTLVRQQRRV